MPDGRLSFDFVHPAQLRECWPEVRAGLEAMLDQIPDRWIPEDVYHALMLGRSTLHRCMRDGECVGFVVLTPESCLDGQALHVWIAYSLTDEPVLEAFFPFIKQCAVAIQAKRVKFHSPRKGWERAAPNIGFKAKEVIYECEV
ncbi:hypothetical protein K6V92_10245 [Cupriavidus respiraculi]|uniref:hypothetical protein n=1 Tax=Cupriavidus respiraculi TaxID=195930 RepID=UPI001C963A90|nr:hypothetical protein [Cupriavidus respiraculi]MBY4946998.1 hypothetical protein [Cupriavidus respiraculi]